MPSSNKISQHNNRAIDSIVSLGVARFRRLPTQRRVLLGMVCCLDTSFEQVGSAKTLVGGRRLAAGAASRNMNMRTMSKMACAGGAFNMLLGTLVGAQCLS